jgi:hypothetical protein
MMLDIALNASGASNTSEKVISYPQPGYLSLKCLRLQGSLEDNIKISFLTGYLHYDSELSWRSYESCGANIR